MLKISNKKSSTIALDFDGVLHSYKSGWTGYEPIDAPVDGALEFVKLLLSKDFKVVIFSSRADTEAGKTGIKNWLKEHNFPAIDVFIEKPHADLYIDDRGFRFSGNFDEVINFIHSGISPWYKKNN